MARSEDVDLLYDLLEDLEETVDWPTGASTSSSHRTNTEGLVTNSE
jgi:hypothetical protein